MQRAVVAMEFPGDVPIWVQDQPSIVFSQAYKRGHIDYFAHSILQFGWDAAPYGPLSGSACEVAKILTKSNEA